MVCIVQLFVKKLFRFQKKVGILLLAQLATFNIIKGSPNLRPHKVEDVTVQFQYNPGEWKDVSLKDSMAGIASQQPKPETVEFNVINYFSEEKNVRFIL